MKRIEAERLYAKYTALGAKVEFKFDKTGGVEAVQIFATKPAWEITVTVGACRIYGALPLEAAEITIDYLLTGKVE